MDVIALCVTAMARSRVHADGHVDREVAVSVDLDDGVGTGHGEPHFALRGATENRFTLWEDLCQLPHFHESHGRNRSRVQLQRPVSIIQP